MSPSRSLWALFLGACAMRAAEAPSSSPPPVSPAPSGELPVASAEPPPDDAPAPPATPARSPLQPSPAEWQACEAKGGKLQPVCSNGVLECVIRYRDAGKRCQDKKDCKGDCLYTKSEPLPPGARVTGECQATSAPCDCAGRVVAGKVIESICYD